MQTENKKKWKTWHKVVLGLIGLSIIGSLVGKKKVQDNTPQTQQAATTDAATSTPEITKNVTWQYSNDVDKMDGTTNYYALNTSTNEVEFQAPYGGGSNFTLGVQKMGKKPVDVYLTVSKGQFLTSVMGDKKARVKFDNEAPFNITVNGTSDGRADLVFFEPASKLLSKMKTAKKLVIECEFFQDGRRQAEFDIENFIWSH